MKKIFAGAALLALLGAGCASSAPLGAANANQNQNAQAGASANQNAPAASVKFVDEPYFKNAYLISGATMDTKTKEATTGFAISKKPLVDGSTEYSLKALKSEYKDQTYVVKPGQSLYFIETFMGDDDVEKNEEKGMRDDEAVLVDADGNVVGLPQSWTK